MKNLTFVFTLLTITLLFCTSCKKKRCVDKEVGSVALNEESISYLTYENGETITFENANGEQLIFNTEVVNEPYFICTKYLCELTTGPFENIPCENYSTTGIRNVLRQTNATEIDETILIELVAGVVNYREESTLFYDLVTVYMNKIGGLARGQIVPFVHFQDPVFDATDTELTEPFIATTSIEIEGVTYENMLLSDESENMLYYQVKEGIKVIKLNDSFYHLVE